MLTLSEERKFQLIFAHGSESSWEREFQGTKVPGSESWTFAPGSESTWEQKFLGTKVPVTPSLLLMLLFVNICVYC